MKKKKKTIIMILIAVILALVLGFGVYVVYDNNKIRTFSELKLDGEKMNSLIEKKELSDVPVESISFNGYPLIYDKTTNRYYYSVIENDGGAINPEVKLKAKFGTKVAFENVTITDDLIHSGETIDMIIYSGKKYTKSEIVCTSLPLINVDTAAVPETKDDQKMHITVFDNGRSVKERLQESDGYIRVKGASTTNYAKKSFRLNLRDFNDDGTETNRDASFLGMRNDDDYMLYAGYNDQEKVRNVFSSNLWYDSCRYDNLAQVENGMYYKYAELFINNEYWGLYALGFPIDKKQLQLKEGENLYKKMEWGDCFDIDYDNNEPVDSFELKTEWDESQAWRDLKDYYDILINSGDAELLYDSIDINNSIDVYLYFAMIIGDDNIDGYDHKNLYMFTKYINGEMKMFYTPWDMDLTWGNAYSKPDHNWVDTYGYESDDIQRLMMQSPVYYLLEMGDEEIKELIRDRYDELRDAEWSTEYMMDMLSGFEADIFYSGAYERDRERWPDGTYNEAGTDLTRFREFVSQRMKFFDSYIDSITE